MERLDFKILDGISRLAEKKLQEAILLLDYGPSNRVALLQLCLKEKAITGKQYQYLLSHYFSSAHQNPNQEYVKFYNIFLDKIGLTNEKYSKFSEQILSTWRKKAIEESDIKIEKILSDRNSLMKFDMWFLLSIRPFDIEAVCNENGYCYYVFSVPDRLDYVLDYDFFENKLKKDLGSIREANLQLFHFLIEQIPELKGKVIFDESEGVVFTVFDKNIDESEIDYSLDCFENEICFFLSPNLDFIKEIGFYISRLYSELEKEYNAWTKN